MGRQPRSTGPTDNMRMMPLGAGRVRRRRGGGSCECPERGDGESEPKGEEEEKKTAPGRPQPTLFFFFFFLLLLPIYLHLRGSLHTRYCVYVYIHTCIHTRGRPPSGPDVQNKLNSWTSLALQPSARGHVLCVCCVCCARRLTENNGSIFCSRLCFCDSVRIAHTSIAPQYTR